MAGENGNNANSASVEVDVEVEAELGNRDHYDSNSMTITGCTK